MYDSYNAGAEPIPAYYGLYFATTLLTNPARGSSATPRRDTAARAFIRQLARDISTHVRHLEMRYLAGALWCLGRLGYNEGVEVARICAAIPRALPQARPQCCANVLQTLVRLEVDDQGALVAAVGARFADVVGDASLQDIALVAWACARLGHVDDHVLHTCYHHALEQAADLKPQQAVNLLWAEAKLRACPHVVGPLADLLAARSA